MLVLIVVLLLLLLLLPFVTTSLLLLLNLQPLTRVVLERLQMLLLLLLLILAFVGRLANVLLGVVACGRCKVGGLRGLVCAEAEKCTAAATTVHVRREEPAGGLLGLG